MSREEAVESMAQYIARVGEGSLALVGILVDCYERAQQIRAEREEAAHAD